MATSLTCPNTECSEHDIDKWADPLPTYPTICGMCATELVEGGDVEPPAWALSP
jgi:hypothetical protein